MHVHVCMYSYMYMLVYTLSYMHTHVLTCSMDHLSSSTETEHGNVSTLVMHACMHVCEYVYFKYTRFLHGVGWKLWMENHVCLVIHMYTCIHMCLLVPWAIYQAQQNVCMHVSTHVMHVMHVCEYVYVKIYTCMHIYTLTCCMDHLSSPKERVYACIYACDACMWVCIC